MEVLNKTQRRSAYWLFVLFFLITVSVLVTAVFFNTYFPFKENSLLKIENAKMKKELETQSKFSFQLEKVKLAVDSIGMPKQNDFFNEKLALSILADMYKQLPKDTLTNKNMYNTIIMTYKDLIDTKKRVKQLSGNQVLIDSLSTINTTLKEEYDKMKIDLDVCKQLYQVE